MIINYVVISSGSQNNDSQVFNLPSENKVFKDTISGSIAFSERPEGAKIIDIVKEGEIDTIYINDISTIGCDNIDVLNMLKFFTENGVNLISRREGLSTMTDRKVNPIVSIIIGILSTLVQHEVEKFKERQRQELARAEDRRTKRKETREDFMTKSDTKKIVKYLNEGNSLRRTALLSQASLGKVQKVAKIIKDGKENKGLYIKGNGSTLRENYIESLQESDSLDAI